MKKEADRIHYSVADVKRRIQPHLRVGEGDVERVTLIAGNPDRVPKIAAEMKDAEEVARYRGFVTYRAYTPGGIPVTISGTGIGTPSTHICIEELATLGAEVIIRIGSCGGIDPEVVTGDVVVPTGCIRDERTGLNYAPMEYPAVASPRWFQALRREIGQLLPPDRIHTGVCWTSDVYYADRIVDQLEIWTRARVKCVEMESSLVYVFASTHGLEAASILSCDGNLHGAQKGEQEDEAEESGEQNPLLVDAVQKSIQATIAAIDSILSE
ncbi:nucleoside phosphorylase [Candidatus Thorarchaeota archaeon]|jgi:uridine phosphorylase|nr:MAG: nucleoside phosphorylase [Candidatus Thorarchaeota archaeon]